MWAMHHIPGALFAVPPEAISPPANPYTMLKRLRMSLAAIRIVGLCLTGLLCVGAVAATALAVMQEDTNVVALCAFAALATGRVMVTYVRLAARIAGGNMDP